MSRMEAVRTQEPPRRSPVQRKLTRAGSVSYLHYTWQSSARSSVCNFTGLLASACP